MQGQGSNYVFESFRTAENPADGEDRRNFLEFKLPARAFATLTTRGRTARYRLDESFSAWIQGIQAHNKATLGWIKSNESNPRLHIHTALIAPVPLDCHHAAQLWQMMVAPRYTDAAKVEPYRLGLCGLGYVLKRLDTRMEEIQFSDNIGAFAPGSGKSLFRTSSAQKRQMRRIKAEIQRLDLEAASSSKNHRAGGAQ